MIDLDPRVVLAEMINGTVRRIVVDTAGVPVDVGRVHRFFTGPLRDALQTVWQRCLWPDLIDHGDVTD